MDVRRIKVRADDSLILAAQQSVGKLHTDLMRQLRGDFTFREALHQVVTLHAFFPFPHFLDGTHIRKRGFARTPDGRLEQALLGFIAVQGISNSPFQGIRTRWRCGFCFIQNIVNASFQTPDRDQ